MGWEVRKRRASGAPGVRFAVTLLPEDDVGNWFILDPFTPHVADGGWVVAVSPNPVLGLVPHHHRWVASTTRTGGKVDLCRSVTVGPDCIEFEDVELDVVWRWGEQARIDDLDEFEALSLPDSDAAGFAAEAEELRLAVDAGREPLGPPFRQRLVDLTEAPDRRLAGTWAGGVTDYQVGEVIALLGEVEARRHLGRQQSGEGWLLWGGRHAISALVWIDGQGAGGPVATAPTADGAAMGAFLLRVAPGLTGFPPPPLTGA